MSQRIERALAALARPGAVLAPWRERGFAVYPHGDRRRRPAARLNTEEMRALESEGAIARDAIGGFALTEAGWARVRRESAAAGEAFTAQHRAIIDRAVLDARGGVRSVRGHDADAAMRKLAALRGNAGEPWLDGAELAAASRLRRDWALAEIGMVRGSDWTAAPIGSSPRSGNAQDAAMARRCDARRRVNDAMARLAPPLRRVVERVCLEERGLEELERAEGWPQRSGKLALKLGLAQLAAALG